MTDSGPTHTLRVDTPQGLKTLQLEAGGSLLEMLQQGGVPVRSDCGGKGTCGQCRVGLDTAVDLPVTEAERCRLASGQLQGGVRLACQVRPQADVHVWHYNPRLSSSWRTLRADEMSEPQCNLPAQPAAGLGLAIDLGTTHIRLGLWDLQADRRLIGLAGLNPQIHFGADVLTRLMLAGRSPQMAKKFAEIVLRFIRNGVAQAAAAAGVRPMEIRRCVVVGNSAMLALLTGRNHAQLLDPDYWTRPIDYQPADGLAFSRALHLSGDTEVIFPPPLGGFVGADLLAGILATGLTSGPEKRLLVDFGTNSEMALWDGGALWVTSAAGGPAFEGSGIGCGMPGEVGAVYRISESPSGLALQTVGGGDAVGLCGSGLVDAIACLLRSGQLDRIGRFRDALDGQGVTLAGNPMLSLKAADIDVFQRAKAAIGAGIAWLCAQAGIAPLQLDRIDACGAFGRLLDIRNAQAIGLLPEIPAARVSLDGNAALAGCEALLRSPDAEALAAALPANLRLFNMAEDPAFEQMFIDHLYLQPMQA